MEELDDFKSLKITKAQLQDKIGENLHRVEIEKPSRLRRIYSTGCPDNNFANSLSGYRRGIRGVWGFGERIRLKNVVPSKIRGLLYFRFAV